MLAPTMFFRAAAPGSHPNAKGTPRTTDGGRSLRDEQVTGGQEALAFSSVLAAAGATAAAAGAGFAAS